MSILDTAKAVLGKASLLDPRMPGPDQGIAAAWAETLGNVNRADALAVVTAHYQKPDAPRLMAGDVLAGVKRIRAERLRAVPSSALEPADVDPSDVEAYQAARLALVRRIADGVPLPEPAQLPKRPVAELVASTAARLPRIPRSAS